MLTLIGILKIKLSHANIYELGVASKTTLGYPGVARAGP